MTLAGPCPGVQIWNELRAPFVRTLVLLGLGLSALYNGSAFNFGESG